MIGLFALPKRWFKETGCIGLEDERTRGPVAATIVDVVQYKLDIVQQGGKSVAGVNSLIPLNDDSYDYAGRPIVHLRRLKASCQRHSL